MAVNSDTTAQYTDSKPTAVPGFTTKFNITLTKGVMSTTTAKVGAKSVGIEFTANAPITQDNVVFHVTDPDVAGNVMVVPSGNELIVIYDALKAGTSDITVSSKEYPDVVATATVTVTAT